MEQITGGCLCGDLRIKTDEIKVHLGAPDAPDQLRPSYESWSVRRESWLPPFPLKRRYERDRDATSRFEDQAGDDASRGRSSIRLV